MSTTEQRYRVEAGEHVVDVRTATAAQLFDNRDPAPFRERDLDPDLVEYLMSAGEDLAGRGPFRVVFWVERADAPSEIEEAYRAHFEHELERQRRRSRRHRRTGVVALAIGATLLVAVLLLSQLAKELPQARIAQIASEGLVIIGWVILWRPVEMLLYDWLPVRRERTVLRHLLAAPVEIRTGRIQADVLGSSSTAEISLPSPT